MDGSARDRIHLRSAEDLARLRAAGLVVHEVLEALARAAVPGVTTADLDALAAAETRARGAAPAFLGYHGYPASLCISVNDEVVHGIPSPRRVLQDGDLVGLDFGAVLDGWYADAARTVAVGKASAEALRSLGRTIGRALSYEVPEEVLVERLSGRRSCPKCGAVYHVTQNPPKRDGYCDRDDAGLVQRDDDKPESVKKRLHEYATKTEPLRRFYRERGLLTEIEGVGTPVGILAVTKRALGR